MKKTLLAIVFAAFAFTANAQSEAGSMFIKPMVGGTLTTLTKIDDAKMTFGFVGGAEFGYQVSDQFAVTVGLLASMQGTKSDDQGIIVGALDLAGVADGVALAVLGHELHVPLHDLGGHVGGIEICACRLGAVSFQERFVIDAVPGAVIHLGKTAGGGILQVGESFFGAEALLPVDGIGLVCCKTV